MKLNGIIKLKGDKSISHRALMIASIIKNQSRIKNISLCQDVGTTIESLKLCNIQIKDVINELIINLYIPEKIIFFSINQLAILSLNPCISPNPVSTNVPNKII